MLAAVIVSASLTDPSELFAPAFAQRALLCIVLVAVVAAALGWAIVLRDLPFFTHAIGSGAYPALVLGVILGVSIAVSALLGALAFAALLALLSGVGSRRGARRSDGNRDTLTGLAVVAALGLGSLLAAQAGAGHERLATSPEALLFGSLLTVDGATLAVLAIVAALTTATSWMLGERWLAGGFDPGSAGANGSTRSDLVLYLAIALAAAAVLPVTGSLLTGALLIVPAATVRMVAGRARMMPLWIFLLALVEGALGLYLALAFDLPTGAAIAAVAGCAFFVVAAAVSIAQRSKLRSPALAAASAAVLALALAGCGSDPAASDQSANGDRVKVVATTPQVADIVRQVGGEIVQVSTLLPAGSDPHDFEVRPSSIAQLEVANLIFRSGGELDGWLLPAVRAAGPGPLPVVLSRSVVLIDTPSGGGINAHWFLDPQNVARAAQRVRDELIKAAPAGRETFRANTTKYLDEIDAQESKLSACTARLAEDERTVVTGHDDFDYLATAFGLKIAARIAPSGSGEASAKALQTSVDAARAAGARAVVTGKGEASELDREVATKLGVPLLALYSDAMTVGDDSSTVMGAISYDVERLAGALSGGRVKCSVAK